MIYIYKLSDPRDKIPRYVGKTNNLKARLKVHWTSKFNTTCSVWIWKLRAEGIKPSIEALEEIPDGQPWQSREQYWIDRLRLEGNNLLNSAPAGAGPPVSHVVSSETREKLRRTFKGRPIPPEQRTKISKSLTGKKQSFETVAKREATRKANRLAKGLSIGRKWTPEYRRMMRRIAGHPARNSPELKAQVADKLREHFHALSPEERKKLGDRTRGRPSPRKGTEQPMTEAQRLNHTWAVRAMISELTPDQKRQRMAAAMAVNPINQKYREALP